MRNCRVIIDGPRAGHWNMAVDEALLQSGTDQPILRLYRWQPATLSLGYFQGIANRQSHVPSLPCPLVRRSSGGGAIVHDAEITYSLIMPQSERKRAAEGLYVAVHDAVSGLLASLGLTTATWAKSRDADRFLCFQRRSPGDIVAGDHKLMGSHQRRYHQTVLQHGSLLLSTSHFAPELLGIEQISAIQFEPEDWQRYLAGAILDALKLSAAASRLSDQEHKVATEIEEFKYGNPAWLNRR